MNALLRQSFKILLVLFFLAFLANLAPVVIRAATHCEIKLAWGEYLDVTRSDWAKDWVKGCKEAGDMPKSEFHSSFDHMKPFQPVVPGKF